MQEIDMDALEEIIKIPYNKQDTNTDIFAKALRNRIISINWKLKNKYFVYGLKKGINDYIISRKDNIISRTNEIKTIMDHNKIMTSINNLKTKNSLRQGDKELIMIGIPYENRVIKNIKEFLNIIYKIEKEQLIIKKKNTHPLIDDTENYELLGKIAKLYENQNEDREIISNRECDMRNQQITNEITEELSRTTNNTTNPFATTNQMHHR